MTDRAFKRRVSNRECIGAAPLLDLLRPERADRNDLEPRGCFVEHNRAQYMPLVSAGYETMRSAALLAAVARGQRRCKTALGDQPACSIQD